MTILGIPEGSGFTIGTSSNIAAPAVSATSGVNKMDMSLDDMIKSRRDTAKPAGASRARSATTADRQVAKGKAKRNAASNARRGLSDASQPTTQQIEQEVVRQTQRATSSTKKQQDQQKAQAKGRKPRSEAEVKVKSRKEKAEAAKNSKKPASETVIPPTWIGGTRRPPSKKAVGAAVEAMEQHGFKVPKGMQMVITFAPAPDQLPASETPKKQPSNSNNSSAKKTNNNANLGAGRGGRGRGRRGNN